MKRKLSDLYSSDQAVRYGTDFVGREECLQELLDCIAAHNCVQVVGQRRIGKSSILVHLTRAGVVPPREEPDLVVYLNLQALAEKTEDAFWSQVLGSVRSRLVDMGAGTAKINLEMPLLSETLRRQARQWFSNLPARVDYPSCVSHLQSLRELGFGQLVLLMDELEVLGEIPTQHDLTQRLRALAADASWPMTFVTASRKPIAELTEGGTLAASPFFNIFSQTVRLTVFNDMELDHLIRLPERLRAHHDLDGAAPGFSLQPYHNTIRRLSGHHPYYASITCRRLVKLASDNHTLTPLELATLEADLKEDLKGQITAAFLDRSPREQLALQRILHPSRLERIPDQVVNHLIQDGLVRREPGQLVIRSSLMADLIPPEKQTPWLNRRRVMALVSLIGSVLLLIQLAEHLLGPLPVATHTVEFIQRPQTTVLLTYPSELRVQEEAILDLVITAEPGSAGQLKLGLSSADGGLQFLDSKVEFDYQIEANTYLAKVEQAKVLPRSVAGEAYDLKMRAEWSPADNGAHDLQQITVFPHIRALSGLSLYIKGAAALLLAITGFFGLSPSSILAWFLAIWRGRKEGDT